MLDRREALLLMLGWAVVPVLPGCAGTAPRPRPVPTANAGPSLERGDAATIDRLAEIIFPTTDTPGAKEAAVGTFIATMLADWYHDDERHELLAGLAQIDARAHAAHGVSFVRCTETAQLALVQELDQEAARLPPVGRIPEARPHAQRAAQTYSILRQLTLVGFFTSEVGGG